MKIKNGPYPNYLLNSQFFWLQFVQPGFTQELPSTTNWMKLWRYITLELKQSSIWFIPNYKEDYFVKVFQKRWSKGNMERVLKRDYAFYAFDDFDSIITSLCSDMEKHKMDWLIIKCTPIFAERYWERIQYLAKELNVRMILIGKQ
jgi:hypothetical protein